MKPVMVQVMEPQGTTTPFFVRSTNQACFSQEFHFHEECKLVYVLESEGKRVVGDNVGYFQEDELVFLGSNVPHVWYNHKEQQGIHSRSIALYFNPGILLKHISGFINVAPLEAMLNASRRGMKFHGEVKKKLRCMLMQMQQLNELQQLSRLINILELMCNTSDFCYLASAGYVNRYERKGDTRMDRISGYVFEHFTEDIPLSEIAAIAHMSEQGFCRYFKIRTKKSFTRFVNEIRIGYACKLLLSPEENIHIVANKSGFNSVSNFNRFFKEIKGMTPSEFKKNLVM